MGARTRELFLLNSHYSLLDFLSLSAGGLTGDFVYSTVSFDFPANMASPTTASGMTLTVVDDDVLEDAEVFEGIFAIPVQVASQIRIRKGMTQVTSIIIEDDDGMLCGSVMCKGCPCDKSETLNSLLCCSSSPCVCLFACLSLFVICVYTYICLCVLFVIDAVVEVSFATESYSVMESSGRVGVQLRVDGKYYIDFQVVVECRDTHTVSAEGECGGQF